MPTRTVRVSDYSWYEVTFDDAGEHGNGAQNKADGRDGYGYGDGDEGGGTNGD